MESVAIKTNSVEQRKVVTDFYEGLGYKVQNNYNEQDLAVFVIHNEATLLIRPVRVADENACEGYRVIEFEYWKG